MKNNCLVMTDEAGAIVAVTSEKPDQLNTIHILESHYDCAVNVLSIDENRHFQILMLIEIVQDSADNSRELITFTPAVYHK